MISIQYPCVQVCGELTTRLNRTITTLDRCLLELFKTIDQSKNYIASVSLTANLLIINPLIILIFLFSYLNYLKNYPMSTINMKVLWINQMIQIKCFNIF